MAWVLAFEIPSSHAAWWLPWDYSCPSKIRLARHDCLSTPPEQSRDRKSTRVRARSNASQRRSCSPIGCTTCIVKSFRSRRSFVSSPLWTPFKGLRSDVISQIKILSPNSGAPQHRHWKCGLHPTPPYPLILFQWPHPPNPFDCISQGCLIRSLPVVKAAFGHSASLSSSATGACLRRVAGCALKQRPLHPPAAALGHA